MVQKLEDIKGGGGSIRVGSTGTISALMTRELESIKSAPDVLVSGRGKTETIPVTVSTNTPRRLQTTKSLDEASSSGSSSSNINHINLETARKAKGHNKSTSRIPIVGSDKITLDRAPSREKPEKKINIVEVVDIRCGNPEKAWGSKLKKLGFSKLSESIMSRACDELEAVAR